MPLRRSVFLLLVALALCAGVWWLFTRRWSDHPAPPATQVASAIEQGPQELSGQARADAPTTTTRPTAKDDFDEAPPPIPKSKVAGVEPTRLRGQVLDLDKLPIAGARVLAVSAPTLGAPYDPRRSFAAHLPLDVADPERLGCDVPFVATTGANGKFFIDGLPPGRVRLCIVSRDHVRHEREDLWLHAGENLNLYEIGLFPGARCTGTVKDASGHPIAGAVLIERDGAFAADLPFLSPRFGRTLGTSDERGWLESVPLGPRWHELALWHPEHALTPFLFDTQAKSSLPAMPVAEALEVFVAPGESDSERRVVRALEVDAQPSAIDFELRADAIQAECDAEQRAQLTGLVRGRRYELRSASIAQAWDDLSPWNPPRIVTGGVARIALPYLADARVVFALDGVPAEPMSQLRLRLFGAVPEFPSAHAIDAGRFELRGVRPLAGARTIELELGSTEHVTQRVALELVSGGVLDLGRIERVPFPRARLFVHQRMGDGTKRPIEGAWVEARPVPSTLNDGTRELALARTDVGGEARVATWGLPNTAFVVRAPGVPPQAFAAFNPTLEREPLVELALRPGHPCRVRVLDADSGAIRGARVELAASLRDGFELSPADPLDVTRLSAEREHPSFDLARLRAARWDLERRADGDLVAYTDVNGVALFPDVTADRASVFVQRYAQEIDGERRDAGDLDLASLSRTHLDVDLKRGEMPLGSMKVSLFPRPARSGPSAWILPDVELPPALDVRSWPNGRVRLDDLSPGRYALCAQLSTQTWRACVELELRENQRTFAVDVGRLRLRGRVVDEHGTGVAGADIVAWIGSRDGEARDGSADELLAALQRDEQRSRELVTRSDARGMFEIVGLPPDLSCALRAVKGAERASKWLHAEVGAEDEPAELELALAGSGALAVRAQDESPRRDALLLLERAEGETWTVRCAIRSLRRGANALLRGLAPGTWRATLAVPRATAARDTLTISPWANAKDLERTNLFALEFVGNVNVVAGETASLEVLLR